MPSKQPLQAKFEPPLVKKPLLRSRLFGEIDGSAQAVWIYGPPGAGKTTLVASYFQAQSIKPFWYNLDDDDLDPSTFFHFLGEARGRWAASDLALPVMGGDARADWTVFARRFIRALVAALPAGTPIVFDNVQAGHEPLFEIFSLWIAEVTEEHRLIFLAHTSPPAPFVTALARRQLTVITAEALRLDDGEVEQFAEAAGLSAKSNLGAIREAADGWMAGLVLLANAEGEPLRRPSGKGASSAFEEYISGRVLQSIPARTLHVLRQCAFFPDFDVSLAVAASGDQAAGELLAALSRDRFFVEQRGAGPHRRYVLHHLLAKALRDGIGLPDSGERHHAEAAAGMGLVRVGKPEAGIGLLLEAGAYADAAACIVDVAKQMVATGREEQLARWVSALPSAEVERQPWLEYWRAIATASFDEDVARGVFEAVYQKFLAKGDRLGMVLVAAAVLMAYESGWQSREGLDAWARIMCNEWTADLKFPNAEAELRASLGMVLAVHRCLAWWPGVDACLDRLPDLVRAADDTNLRLQTALILDYLNHRREYDRGLALVEYIDKRVDLATAHPLFAAQWLYRVAVFESWAGRLQGRPFLVERAAARRDRGLELAERYGLGTMHFALTHLLVDAELAAGNDAGAKKHLNAAASMIAPTMWRDQAWHQVRSMRFHLIAGEPAKALKAWDAARPLFKKAAYPPNTSNDCAELVGAAYLAARNFREARHWLMQAIAYSTGGARESIVELLLFCDAYAALTNGGETTDETIRRFLVTVKDWRVFGCEGCLERQLAELCSAAIKRGIELGKVMELVKLHRLLPPAEASGEWPWPVRIEALGGFQVSVWGEPLESEGKTRRRSMDVMKYLVARTQSGKRERGVRIDKILEELWPAGESKDPKGSFDISVHRLRKLLTIDNAIEVAEGTVRFNPNIVWCDAFDFEIKAQRALLGDGDAAAVAALYKGPLLGREDERPWSMPAEERFAAIYSQLIVRQGEAHERREAYREAIEVYERGLAQDLLSEVFYRGLIRCYLAMDEPAAALRAYRRCRDMLNVVAGVNPSADTEKLREQIRNA